MKLKQQYIKKIIHIVLGAWNITIPSILIGLFLYLFADKDKVESSFSKYFLILKEPQENILSYNIDYFTFVLPMLLISFSFYGVYKTIVKKDCELLKDISFNELLTFNIFVFFFFCIPNSWVFVVMVLLTVSIVFLIIIKPLEMTASFYLKIKKEYDKSCDSKNTSRRNTLR